MFWIDVHLSQTSELQSFQWLQTTLGNAGVGRLALLLTYLTAAHSHLFISPTLMEAFPSGQVQNAMGSLHEGL